MKKVLLMLGLGILSFQSYAAIGFSISITKGVKEWNKDHTDVICASSWRICDFTISANVSMSTSSVAQLSAGKGGIFNEDGVIYLCLPAATLTDENYSTVFEEGTLILNDDHVFTDEEKQLLGTGTPDSAPAGAYPYTITDDGTIKIVLN